MILSVPISGNAAELDYALNGAQSGTTGDCTWSVEDSVLTISGDGPMKDYEHYNAEWCPWKDLNILRVVIENGVTAIGNNAFEFCSTITSVEIPDTVTRIGYYAFSGCKALRNIHIPNSVVEIGIQAFYKCESLVEANIPTQIKSLYSEFMECSNLETVIMHDDIQVIGSYSFHNCKKLNNVKLPTSLLEIGDNAFSGCSSLERIEIPSNVSTIGTYSFSGCDALSVISVDSLNKKYDSRNYCNAIIETESDTLVKGCKSTVIPNTVLTIGEGAFDNCSGLSYAFIPEGVVSVEEEAFFECYNLLGINIPSTVTSIGKHAFAGCGNISSIVVNQNNKVYDSRNNCNAIIETENRNLIQGCGSTTIPEEISSIEDYAFYKCNKLSSLVIPKNIGLIESKAFFQCENLSSIQVDPQNVVYDSRNNCNAIIETQTNHLKWGCGNTVIPDGVTVIESYAFQGNKVLSKIDIPNSVTSLGFSCFNGCSGLTSIVIPGSVKIIDSNAFINCNNLSEVTMCEGVERIGRWAFSNCDSLKKVVVPRSVNHIGESYAFEDSPNVTIYGYTDSYAEEFANGYRIPFVALDGAKTSIVDCVLTLSQTEFTYDGKAKKPIVTVKYNSVALNEGTDYTVSYKNNVNVGTATATVTGIGDYTGIVDKTFTITAAPKISITNCTITLNQSSYTYDGTAKKPTVTVKYNNVVLIKDTDFTVSYLNNINVGTAIATVTGKGNYTGTVSKNFTINPKQKEAFVWAKDNWNFNNSATSGYFKRSTYRNQISDGYLNVLKKNLSNSEYEVIFNGTYYGNAWLDNVWSGSCYGMSSTALLSKEGILPYSNYKSGATKLYDLNYPIRDNGVSSLVTYYQMLQVKDIIQQQYRTVPSRSNETNIKNIISLLDSHSTVLIGFKKDGWGGHAILATGYEYGSWTWNRVTYQGCIKICDPNCSRNYSSSYNIYFNTQTYNWTIPGYTNMTSSSGARFNYIGANVNEINKGGYLSGTTGNKIDEFVARIDAAAISENRSVTKVIENSGNYINQNTAPGDIEEDYSYILGNESEGTIGYNLYDPDSAYRVSQTTAQDLQLGMDYENCNI